MRVAKFIKPFLLGVAAAYGIVLIVLFSVAMLGLAPVQADVAPSRLEARLLGSALHAAVARHASSDTNPMPPSEENLIAGATIYRQMCARCHGASKESDSTLGQSFYPPAPHLPLARLSYTDGELFWIVKHGIRNTAMPAWGAFLSDQEIWQVITQLRKFDSLPDS
jgi:mono/diheme cytochrome c family protein